MPNENKQYPFTLAGLYKNTYSEKFVANSVPIDRQRADEMCAAIQSCVGGILEIREWGGMSKNGKKLPEYKLEGLTAQMLADRKAYIASQKAGREAVTQGDDAL